MVETTAKTEMKKKQYKNLTNSSNLITFLELCYPKKLTEKF